MKYVVIQYNERTADNGKRVNLADYLANEFSNHDIRAKVFDCTNVEDILIAAHFKPRKAKTP